MPSRIVLLRLIIETRRAPPGTGTGLNNTALISVNTMVLRPMPRARVATTAAENQAWEMIIRSANRRSFLMCPSYGMTNDLVPGLTRNSEQTRIRRQFFGFRDLRAIPCMEYLRAWRLKLLHRYWHLCQSLAVAPRTRLHSGWVSQAHSAH